MTSSVLYKYKKSGAEGRLRTEKEYLNNALVIDLCNFSFVSILVLSTLNRYIKYTLH